LRILVVEDDPSLRVVIRMVLERGGYEVDEAAHGRAALDRVAASRPDMVLADMKMPIMGGLELIDRLRSSPASAQIPVVLLSGVGFSEGHPASAVVTKPFEPADLLATISSVLRAAGSNQPSA
jgi:CheY-like chemotaxis protein